MVWLIYRRLRPEWQTMRYNKLKKKIYSRWHNTSKNYTWQNTYKQSIIIKNNNNDRFNN